MSFKLILHNKELSSRQGLTLVEIVVATGVMGFVLTGVLSFYANSVLFSEANRGRTKALAHAQFVLEDIRATSFSQLFSKAAEGGWTWDVEKLKEQELAPLKDEQVTTTVYGEGILTITTTVDWKGTAGHAQSLSLTTELGGA